MEPLKTTKPWKSEIWQLRLGSGPQGLIVIMFQLLFIPDTPKSACEEDILFTALGLVVLAGRGMVLDSF